MFITILQLHQKNMKRLRCESGQDIVEYGLIVAFISVIAIALLIATGTSYNTIWTEIQNTITSVV